MLTCSRRFGMLALLALGLTLSTRPAALADEADGIVRVKSAYSFGETIARLKTDVAEKGIRFFMEVDQTKLAADAGPVPSKKLGLPLKVTRPPSKDAVVKLTLLTSQSRPILNGQTDPAQSLRLEKPVELAVRALHYSSRPGENVLDLFGGSGSTLIAAEQTGRRALLMELDPLYVDVLVQRWQNFTGRRAERDGR